MKYKYLKKEFVNDWINGKIRLRLASYYFSAERSGTSTPDENKYRNIFGSSVEDIYQIAHVGPKSNIIMNIGSIVVGGIEKGRGVMYHESHEDGLVLCLSNVLSEDLAQEFQYDACVGIEDHDIAAMVLEIDKQVNAKGVAGNCKYTLTDNRSVFEKSIEDEWQNEFRIYWQGSFAEFVDVEIPKGIVKEIDLNTATSRVVIPVRMIHPIKYRGFSHNYQISSLPMNNFVIGDPRVFDDFHISGFEPTEGSMYPIVSATILDENGHFLIKIVKNRIVENPKHCFKRFLSNGYQILDKNRSKILSITTEFIENKFLSNIEITARNKANELLIDTQNQKLVTYRKCIMGFDKTDRSFGYFGFNEVDVNYFNIHFLSKGEVFQHFEGLVEDREIYLDGSILKDVIFRRCKITLIKGTFFSFGSVQFHECEFRLMGESQNILNLLSAMHKPI